jgi:predicted transglutaminase-like cysteine proteinase
MPLTLAAWETLVAVNEQVNATIRAMPDREHWGVPDRWDFPDDGIGDCEDIQLLKRKQLVEEGLPRRALRMAVVFDEIGDGHAVLMALTDRGEFILDNKRSAVLPWNQTGYTYLKREGSDGLAWASLVGQLSPVTADVAAHLREKALSAAPATSSSTPAESGV